MRLRILAMACFAAAIAAQAQPLVFNRGVVNAASYLPAGLPNGSIARGSMFSIFGRQIGPASAVQVSAFPLPTTLGGVSVRLTQGTTTADALPIFVVAGQINAIMPSNAPLGLVSLRVSFNGQSNPVPVRVVASSFGAFAANSAGFGPGIIQNFISAESQPINAPGVSATAGQVGILWGTGLGAGLNADNAAPQVGNLATAVEVYAGGKQAEVLYSGRTPCCSSIDQIVFRTAPDTPLGCWVPVQVRTGGAVTSNTVTMAISGGGGACSQPDNPMAETVLRGGKYGLAALVRSRFDYASVHFRQSTAGPFPFDPRYSFPPEGACTVYGPTRADETGLLDAGLPFGIVGPSGASFPVSRAGGVLFSSLGTAFFKPGEYSVSGNGGRDVGRFSSTIGSPTDVVWTGKAQTVAIDRNRPLEVAWSGVSPSHKVLISATSTDLPTNSPARFYCLAPAGASRFTVPAYILSALPPHRGNPTRSAEFFRVIAISPTPFSASGIDAALGVSISIDEKEVEFQ